MATPNSTRSRVFTQPRPVADAPIQVAVQRCGCRDPHRTLPSWTPVGLSAGVRFSSAAPNGKVRIPCPDKRLVGLGVVHRVELRPPQPAIALPISADTLPESKLLVSFQHDYPRSHLRPHVI
jgi:hypothetical protein